LPEQNAAPQAGLASARYSGCMRVLTAVTAALVALAIATFCVAHAWYHDDQCMIAQWKCDAGTVGLFGAVMVGPIAAVAALVTMTAWGVHAFQSAGQRSRRDH
jgi:hypothetical protein